MRRKTRPRKPQGPEPRSLVAAAIGFPVRCPCLPYAVRFWARKPLAGGALADHFARRPRFTADGDTFRYENKDTGVSFAFVAGGDAAVALELDVPRAPFFAVEAEVEASALVAELDLQVIEHDREGDGGYSRAALLRDYDKENAAAHAALLEAEGEPQELPTSVLLGVWRWNMERQALEDALGGVVPQVVIAVHPETGQTCTMALLSGSRPSLLPHVDLLLTNREGENPSWVATRDLTPVLEPLGVRSPRFRYRIDDGLREAGLPHYDLSKDAELRQTIRDASKSDGDPPRVVPMSAVYARELTRLAMGIEDSAKHLDKEDPADRFPRECSGFLKTRTYALERVLGGYTWLSPWKLESIAFAQGRGVVAGVGAGGVVFFDVESGKRIREARGDVYAGTSVGISDDGRTLAVGNELGSVDVFDVTLDGHGPVLMKRNTFAVDKLDSPPHGHVLGVSPDGSVVIGDVGDDIVVLRDGEEHTMFRATGPVCAARDLLRVWTGTALLDVTTEQELLDLGVDAKALRVPALSPDGRHLAFANVKGELTVVRMDDGAILAVVARMDARQQPVVARFLAFTPDGKRLVVGDSVGLEIRAATTLELEKSFETPMWDASVSADAIYRVADDRIWTQPLDGPAPPVNDGPITQLFHSARGPIALATSAPGEAMTGGRAVLWHIPSGTVLRATERLCPDRVNLTKDGRFLCMATESSLRVLDVGTLGEVAVVEPLGNERYVRPIDLDASPDGEHVLACLEDGLARMFSIQSGMEMWRGDLGIRCATFTPDGSKVVVGDASRLRVLEAETGLVEKEVALEDPRPDAEHVLLGNGERAVRVAADAGIAVVDLAAETAEVFPFPGARDVVTASPDSSVVAVLVDGARDVELVLWSVEKHAEVDRLCLTTADDTPVSAAFSPDGKRLLVGTARGALLVFS
jgi:WD40 repeat protein